MSLGAAAPCPPLPAALANSFWSCSVVLVRLFFLTLAWTVVLSLRFKSSGETGGEAGSCFTGETGSCLGVAGSCFTDGGASCFTVAGRAAGAGTSVLTEVSRL